MESSIAAVGAVCRAHEGWDNDIVEDDVFDGVVEVLPDVVL